MNKLKSKDYLIIASIILIAIIFLFVNLSRDEGSEVVVKIDDITVARYSLKDEGEYAFIDGNVILVIQDGKVWVKESNCDSKECVKRGKISKEGDFIMCVFNHLFIKVIGENNIVEI